MSDTLNKGDSVKLKTGITLYFYEIEISAFDKDTIVDTFSGETKDEALDIAKMIYPGYNLYKFKTDEPCFILHG